MTAPRHPRKRHAPRITIQNFYPCLHRFFPLTIYKKPCEPPLVKLKERQRNPMSPSGDVLQGTLDLLILKTVALEPMHGWGIAQRIQQSTKDVLQIQQGSLYPALYRLERKKWIKAQWGASENNRRAKFYELTKAGRKQLETEKDEWKKLIAAVAQVLETV